MNKVMVPLIVEARLGGGVAHATPWGISLDGLLASEIHENYKAECRAREVAYEPFNVNTEPEPVGLPLGRCTRAGEDNWHWTATFAWPENEIPGPHIQYWSARPDHYALDQLSDGLPTHVSERQGRYRARVMPLPLTVAKTLVWRAVGDPDVISELLADVATIGRKRSSGHGHILEWTVTADPTADPWTYSHLHPDGSLGRTVHVGCLNGRPPVDTGGDGQMGLRPPYMHPSTRREVLLPAR
ncbi:MAG: CRISPR type IV-associated protein Csf3 [Rhodococcus sp. (in: high G+C Gram-positive bacteria)]|jgi:CRISPR type IV-associated protein Csf3